MKQPLRSVNKSRNWWARQTLGIGAAFLWPMAHAVAAATNAPLSPTNIFAPNSTPAETILGLSKFVLEVTGAIFFVVFSLLVYAVVKFGKKKAGDDREPAQVYGSNQVE